MGRGRVCAARPGRFGLSPWLATPVAGRRPRRSPWSDLSCARGRPGLGERAVGGSRRVGCGGAGALEPRLPHRRDRLTASRSRGRPKGARRRGCRSAPPSLRGVGCTRTAGTVSPSVRARKRRDVAFALMEPFPAIHEVARTVRIMRCAGRRGSRERSKAPLRAGQPGGGRHSRIGCHRGLHDPSPPCALASPDRGSSGNCSVDRRLATSFWPPSGWDYSAGIFGMYWD